MPFYRSETKFYIYILVFVFFVGLTGFLGYTYFRVREINKESRTEIFPERKFPKDQRLIDIVEREAVSFPATGGQVEEECLAVPPDQSVVKGVKSWGRTRLLSEEKYNQGKDLFMILFMKAD